MSDTRFSLDQLRTAFRGAAPDAALRVRRSDAAQVTTAERGFAGRVVTFFKPDAEGNRAIANSLLRGLQDTYGQDAAATAFRSMLGGAQSRDGVTIDASKPITARQACQVEDLARALDAEQRRDAAAARALRFAPDTAGFSGAAAEAGVDAAALGDDRKELYRRFLQQRVLEAGRFGRPDAPPLGQDQLRGTAASALAHVAALGDEEVAAAQARLAEQQDAGASLLRGLGRAAPDGAGLARRLLRFELAAVAGAKDAGLDAADAQGAARSRDIALDRALAELSPREARAIYEQAMGPGGAGRAMVFAAAVQGWANLSHGDALRAGAGMQLADSAAAVLAALGRRGGVEDADAAAEAMLAAARAPGIRLAKPGAQGPVRLTKDEVLAAGIEDRRAANAALGQAGAALNGLARAVRTREAEAAAQVRREATEANLRAVREFVLDDGRIGPLLDQHLPGHDGTSQRARLEIRALVMDQVKHEARAGLRQGGEVRPLDPEGVEGAVRRAIAGSSAAIRRILEKPASEDRLAAELFEGRLAGTMARVADSASRRLEARLLASSGGGAAFDQQETRRIAEELAALPNRELLGHLRDILSVGMLELRLALQNDTHNLSAQAALADLNTFEGLVQEELANRVVEATDAASPPPGEAPISGRQAATLADIEKRAWRRDLGRQEAPYLEGKPAAPRSAAPGTAVAAQRIGLSVAELDKALRDADLTINLPASLFKPDGPFLDAEGRAKPDEMRLKNIFERPPGLKGPLYMELRTAFEHLEMPTLRELDAGGVKPADHPVSAGLNVGRNVGGSAPGYGACLIVLKDEVKRTRATFTAQDSFRTYTARATPESVAAFAEDLKARIDARSPALLSKAEWKQLARDLPTIEARLVAAGNRGERLGLGEAKSLAGFIKRDLLQGLPSDTDEVADLLRNIGARRLGDPVESPSHVASFQRIDEILGGVTDTAAEPVLRGLGAVAADPLRVNTVPKGYIEAQVFGGIDLLRDVKEIRIDPGKFDAAAQQALVQLGKDHGIPVTFLDPAALGATRLATDETVKADIGAVVPADARPRMVRDMDGFRASGRLESVLDTYRAHEQGFDPGAVNGRMHVARTLIYADVMANVVRSQGGAVDSDVLFTAVGLHDAGRKGEGPDRWEADSAAAAKRHYVDIGVDTPAGENFRDHVAACIDSAADPRLRTVEGMILKSADSLDSIRHAGRDGYDPGQLWFMGRDARLGEGRYLLADPVLREALMEEVAGFIEMTEPKVASSGDYLRAKDAVAALAAELADAKAELGPAAGGRGVQDIEAELRDGRAALATLRDQVAAETQAANRGRGSLEIFDSAVAALRDNPDRFPLMNRYYKPDGGLASS